MRPKPFNYPEFTHPQPLGLTNRFLAAVSSNEKEQERGLITMFLKSGVALSGRITCYDYDSLTLYRDGVTQLVFRDAVATIMPQDAIKMSKIIGDCENVELD